MHPASQMPGAVTSAVEDQLQDAEPREIKKAPSWDAGIFIRVKVKVFWSLESSSVHGGGPYSGTEQSCNLFHGEEWRSSK